MVGAVIGDCLGSPVECLYWEGIEVGFVLDKFAGYRESAGKKKPKLIEYTDDTAMVSDVTGQGWASPGNTLQPTNKYML